MTCKYLAEFCIKIRNKPLLIEPKVCASTCKQNFTLFSVNDSRQRHVRLLHVAAAVVVIWNKAFEFSSESVAQLTKQEQCVGIKDHFAGILIDLP